MSKLSQHCKYLHRVYENNLKSPLFHTSRSPGITNLAQDENNNEPDYLNSLRPASLNIADQSNSDLAGQPRGTDRLEGIRPEIYEKWNQRPKIDRKKEWHKSTTFY